MSSSAKLERFLNLLALLLDAVRPVRVEDIQRKIEGYTGQTDDTFKRTFERDKAELRDLGFEIEHVPIDEFGAEMGYRIVPSGSLLDDLGFTAAELASLSLAMQAWSGSADAAQGMLKITAVSGSADPVSHGWLLPRVDVDDTVTALLGATMRRKRVRFSYRTRGAVEVADRIVDPHGLVFRGAWYLVGYDHDRGEVRRFKVGRMGRGVKVAPGTTPDFDAPSAPDLSVWQGPWGSGDAGTARVRFAPEVAWMVERRTGRPPQHRDGDGWAEFELPMADVETFAGWVAGFVDKAVALEPAALRDAVVARLRHAAGVA